jgi:subtilisin family serine protease
LKADCAILRKKARLFAVLAFSLFLASSLDAQQPSPRTRQAFHPRRIVIEQRDGIQPQTLASVNSPLQQKRRLKALSRASKLQIVELLPGETVEEVVQSYRRSGLVKFAEPDYLLKLHALPDDPEFKNGNLWALRNTGQFGGQQNSDIAAVTGWDTLSSASNVVVAVIDTGVRYTHEDLAPNIWVNPGEIPGNNLDDDQNGFIDDVHGINAVTDSGDPTDLKGHGTHVAGIIGAVGNNGKGICGVAWQVKIMPLSFFDETGFGATSDAIQCIDYAVQHGAKIINASWGGEEFSESFLATVERARKAGVIIVTSAGNENSDNDLFPIYPGNYDLDNIVVVTGTNRRDELDPSYANYGAESVDLAAPGSSIYSTWANWDGSYTFLSGTSMAAPYVSGALALLKARYPDDTERALIERLYAATDPVESLQGFCKTGGRLNLAKALGPPPPRPILTLLSSQKELQIQLQGVAGEAYILEQSPDLVSWLPFSTNSLPVEAEIVLPVRSEEPQLFYRARAQ